MINKNKGGTEDMSDINEETRNDEEIVTGGNDTIKISNDVVATYAGIAVSEVEGVYEAVLQELQKSLVERKI